MAENKIMDNLISEQTWEIIKLDVERYVEIKKLTDLIRKGKLSLGESMLFCESYCSFYNIRRDLRWKKEYFNLLEKRLIKNDYYFSTIDRAVEIFEKVVSEVGPKSYGKVETSFASKLLHTINDNFPIYDKNVRESLGITEIYSSGYISRKDEAVQKYKRICDFYYNAEYTEKRDEMIKMFDYKIGNTIVSKVKKIDYILWGRGKNIFN